MAGNKEGSRKAVATVLARDPDYYKKIGHKGGSKKTDKPKGFAADHERARIAGARGGKRSKRGKAK